MVDHGLMVIITILVMLNMMNLETCRWWITECVCHVMVPWKPSTDSKHKFVMFDREPNIWGYPIHFPLCQVMLCALSASYTSLSYLWSPQRIPINSEEDSIDFLLKTKTTGLCYRSLVSRDTRRLSLAGSSHPGSWFGDQGNPGCPEAANIRRRSAGKFRGRLRVESTTSNGQQQREECLLWAEVLHPFGNQT